MTILKSIDLSKTFANHKALDHVSITIPRQSIVGLLGPNGAGKTTFIRIITQIFMPDEGSVLFNDEKLSRKHVLHMGYMPEERGLYKKMKVGEQLLYLAQLKGLSYPIALEKVKKWLKKLDMESWWGKKIEELSKGMQQKVQFIAAIIHDPDLIILDEPFSGFDPINANLIKDEILQLKKEGKSIIFSTHRMESVEELCDYMVLINQSQKIVEGKVHDIKNSYKHNLFNIETDQPIPADYSAQFNILDSYRMENNHIHTTLELKSPITNNELLRLIMNHATIYKAEEQIPSIKDIFIQKVNESKNKLPIH